MATYASIKYDMDLASSATGTGALTLLSTQTASSSSTISFTSGIDSTYKEYIFKYIDVHPSVNGTTLQFNGSDDSSSHSYNITKTTTYFQAYHNEGDTDTTLGYSTGNDLAQGTGFQILHQIGSDNDQAGCGTLHLYDPSNTTFVKHFLSDCHVYHKDDYSQRLLVAGYANVTAAIDGVQFGSSSGNIDAGTIKMYGVV